MKLEVLNTIEEDNWTGYLNKLNGSCLHSYKWSRYSSENNSERTLYFILRDKNNHVIAISFGLYSEKKIGIKLFSSLSFGSMAAANSDEHIREMAFAIKKYCIEHKIVVLTINSFGTPYGSDVLSDMGLESSKRWEFLLNINIPEDELWKKLHSTKRRSIRRGEKNELLVVLANKIDDLFSYRNLAIETHERKIKQGISYPEAAPKSYFRLLKKTLIDTGIGKLYLAYHEGKVVAGAFIIGFNKKTYYMLSSSNEIGLKKSAPDLIIWKSILDYQKDGYLTFNLGGLSFSELNGQPLDQAGLYRFKKRFNTDVVQCSKGIIILRPLQYKIHNILKKIRNRFVS